MNHWNYLCIDRVNICATEEPDVREFSEVSQYDKSVKCQENASQMRAEYIWSDSKPTRGVQWQRVRSNYKRVHDELSGQ